MYRKLLLPLILLVLLALHLPFLQADPDSLLTWHSRGAYTDEGLYTAQIRNLVNHGRLGINQTDGFAKAPLFSVYMLPFMAVGGTHLWLARLAILLFFLFTLYWVVKSHIPKSYQALAFGLIGLQYLVFHYSHFAMGEMLASSFILWSLHSYLQYIKTNKPAVIAWAALALLTAFMVKTNHLYAVAILPAVLGLNLIAALIKHNKANVLKHTKALLLTIGVYGVAGNTIYLLYYMPNRALYTKIYHQEVAGKFEPTLNQLWDRATFNLGQIGNEPVLQLYLVATAIVCLLLLVSLTRSGMNPAPAANTQRHWLLFTAIWFVAELHKLPVLHLPSRYLVATFLAIAMLLVGGLPLIQGRYLKVTGVGLACLLIGFNLLTWQQAFGQRTCAIQNLNLYMAQTADANRTILGTWAPGACWESKNITMPVWENYFNDTSFMEAHHPQAIITETDERDAGYIYSKRGLDLKSSSDSVKVFKIAEWDVAVFWLKK